MPPENLKECAMHIMFISYKLFYLAYLDVLGELDEDHPLMQQAAAFDAFLDALEKMPSHSPPRISAKKHNQALADVLQGMSLLLQDAEYYAFSSPCLSPAPALHFPEK